MEGTRDTGIPKFRTLEEEKEYWEARGPLAEEHEGRMNKPKHRQKRSSFLAVRLTGEELTRLRDVAAKQGLGPSTFARLLLTSAIENENRLPKHMALDQLKDMLENNLSQSIKDRAESLARDASIGSPDKPAFLIDNSQVSAWEEFGLQAISTLLAMYNVQIINQEHRKYKKVKTLVQSGT